MNIKDILPVLRDWLKEIRIPCQILADSDESLRVIFETGNALAELIAGDGKFAPYRHVAFTVLDVRLEPTAGPVFCFYDDSTHTLDDILRELDRGIRCVAEL